MSRRRKKPEIDLDAVEGLKIWNKIIATKTCERCGKQMKIKGWSFFNDEVICEECKAKEQTYPEYKANMFRIKQAAKAGLKS